MPRWIGLLVIAACSSPPHDVPIDAEIDAARIDAPLLIDGTQPEVDGAAEPLDPMTELQKMHGLCTRDEWCWQFPSPTGNRYFKVWAGSLDNIWLTGARGTLLQWNGSRWISHTPPALAGQDFVRLPFSIHGRSANDMWLILSSAVEHWNGATWTIYDSGPTTVAMPFHTVWAAPNSNDVYTTGMYGLKRSQNGGPFMMVYAAPNTTTIWGTAADDIYFTVAGGVVHYDGGTTFTTEYSEQGKQPAYYQGVKNDVWVSGPNNTLAHFDGTSWTPVTTGLGSTQWISGAGYRAANDVWWLTNAGGSQNQTFLHWNGASITSVPIDEASFGEFCCPGLSSAQIIGDRWWIVGGDGSVYTKVGSDAVAPVISPAFLGDSMWGTADNDMYFGGGSELRHWDGMHMTRVASPIGNVTGIANAGIGGTHELFGVSSAIDFARDEYVYSAYHFDGLSWTATELSRFPASPSVTPGPDQFRLYGVYPLRAGEAILYGEKGRAFRFKNGSWHAIATGVTADLRSIWGPDPDHLWIAGFHGTLLRWDSAHPDVMTPDTTFPTTTDDLGSISGADGIMWVANAYTTYTTVVRKHTTAGWSLEDANVQVQQLLAISATNVLATSFRNGTVSRWNGKEFVLEDFGDEGPFYYAFRPPGGHTWLTMGSSVVVHP